MNASATIEAAWPLSETWQRARTLVMSEALSPERILFFFGKESSLEILELLSQTFENLEGRHILNAIRDRTAPDSSPVVQVLHARLPGLLETQAALAVSRSGAASVGDSSKQIHVFLLLVSPDGKRTSDRAYLRRASGLFSARKYLAIRLSRLLSAEAVIEAIREAEAR